VRVLVTGATGLIGRHVLEALSAAGHEVVGFQRALADGIPSVQGDIRSDREALGRATQGCQAVVHLAGRGDVGESRRDPVGYAELNASGALHAIEAARHAGATFVLASSQRVYPLQPKACQEDASLQPDSPYGYAKWVAELWCRMASEQFGVTTRVLRFFSVYGPGQQAHGGSGVVSIFTAAALAGEPLVVQSAGRRDFTDARDVARGVVETLQDAANKPGSHRVYNIATGTGTTFRELASAIVRITRSTSPIQEAIDEPPGADLVADISRARADLDYAPCIALYEGLEHYVKWLRTQSCS
jgi:UDP-glucose 4-epimerase